MVRLSSGFWYRVTTKLCGQTGKSSLRIVQADYYIFVCRSQYNSHLLVYIEEGLSNCLTNSLIYYRTKAHINLGNPYMDVLCIKRSLRVYSDLLLMGDISL